METKRTFSTYNGESINNNVTEVSKKVGKLIDDGLTEKVHKSTIREPRLNI